mgnify:CR=1 FL=1
MVQWFTNFANQVHQRRHRYLPIVQRGKIFKKQPTIPPVACGERGISMKKCSHFFHGNPGGVTKRQRAKIPARPAWHASSCRRTPSPYPFLTTRCPAPASGRGFPFISTAIKCWVDTYSRLTGPVTAPLGTNPVFTPLGGPGVYAAWRARCLRRLARAQYLRRLGYNALSSLIIL